MTSSKQVFSQLVKSVYQDDANKETIEEIRKEFPADVVIDMTDDVNFKAARKTKTRRNKMVEAIKSRSIAFTNEVKDYADDLTSQVNDAFEPVVSLFEIEDKARKEKAAEEKRIRDEMLFKQRSEIDGLKSFLESARGSSSSDVADIIEAVDLIETDCFDKELIHEAIETKKNVIEELHQLLRDTKAREATERERQKLAEEAAEQAKKAGIQDRLSKLQNIPMSMFGKSSAEIESKIESIKSVQIIESEFFDRTAEAEQAKSLVVQQLEMMLQQAHAIESANKQNKLAEQKKQEQDNAMAELEAEQSKPVIDNQEREALQEVNKPLLGDTIKTTVFDKVKDVEPSKTPEGLSAELAAFSAKVNLSIERSAELQSIVAKYF